MINKKGFTIIEIIVCITLIAVIGVSSVVAISAVKKNDDKNNQKLLNTLAEAASVYISVEKDEKGNSYENGLFYGGTGVFIPIEELHDKGYISDSVITTLEKNENYIKAKEDNKAYLLAAVFSDESSECKGENAITYSAEWLPGTDKMNYICSYRIDDKASSNIKYLIYDLNGGTLSSEGFKEVNIVNTNEVLKITDKIPTKTGYTFDGWYEKEIKKNPGDIVSDIVVRAKWTPAPQEEPRTFDEIVNAQIKMGIPNLDTYKDEDKGLYIMPDTNNNVLYYYGKVDNNYLKFDDKIWRIVRTNDNGHLKLVLNDNIPVTIDEDKNIVDNDSIFEIYKYTACTNFMSCLKNDVCYYKNNDDIQQIGCNYANRLDIGGYNSLYDTSNIMAILENFFDSIDDEYGEYIVKNKYCKRRNNSTVEMPYSLAKRDFSCENAPSTKGIDIGLIDIKELIYTGGVNSFLKDYSKDFITSDGTGVRGEYYCEPNSKCRLKKGTSETPLITSLGGRYEDKFSYYYYGLRPVINLRSTCKYTGDGSYTNPYEIVSC